MTDNVKRFEFRLGKWGLGIFVGGMSLLVFFSFVFGVFVGKDLDAYPEKYSWGISKQIMGVAGLSGKSESPKTVVAVREVGKERPSNENSEYDLSFYETLSKKSNNLRTQPSGNEGMDKSPAEPAAPVGGEGAAVLATPAVPATGLLPGNKPGLEKKEEKKFVRKEKEIETSHRHKSDSISKSENEKKSVVKPMREKVMETGIPIAEKKSVHKAEKNIVPEKKLERKVEKNIVTEKKTDQKVLKNITAEKKADQRPEKKATVEKKADQKVVKNVAAEKKPDRNFDRKDVKKEEKGQKPEGKKYTVQVASYQDKGKADQVAGKLKSLGYATRVVPMDLPGKGRWYRLTIGGLPSHDKAKEAVTNVEKKIGGSKGFIRPEGVENGETAAKKSTEKQKTTEPKVKRSQGSSN